LLAFISRDGLSTVALEGGTPQVIVADSVQPLAGGVAWGPDEMLYFRKLGQGIWRVPAIGGEQKEVTALADGDFGHLWPEVLPNLKGILFTRDLGAPADDSIAIVSLETGMVRTLLQGAMARYAHSGHIVYTSGDGTLLAAPFDAEGLEITGASRVIQAEIYVNPSSASFFALSETGVLVYRPARVTRLLPTWIGRDGSEEVLDATLGGVFQAPAISPDGRSIALQNSVDGEENIWIYELGGTFTPLTFEGNNIRPFWSPDGSEVGFISDRRGLRSVFSVARDRSGTVRLLRDGENVPVLEALWTPDAQLVYREGIVGEGNNRLVYAAPHSDSASVTIVAGGFRIYAPALSPNGRWLAYTSGESGQDRVYARPFPGPGGQVPVSLGGGSRPVWANDGEIIYLAEDGFWVATVQTESGIVVGERRRFASAQGFASPQTTQHFDVSAVDGRLLALRIEGGELAAQVQGVVIQNFFEELKRLVPN